MNQHYVPRVYLKNFAEKRGSEYYVDVYDKKTNKVFNTNITNICAERHLYTLDENSTVSTDKLAVEKMYAIGFEPMYQRIYELLINDQVFHLTDLQRAEVLLSVFQLYMRNPRIVRISMEHHRVAISDLISEALDKGEKGISYLNEDFSFRDWTEKLIVEHVNELVTKSFKEGHITGIGELGGFHEFSKLEVNKNKGDALYFTSDNPLVIEDLIDKENQHPMEKSREFIIALNPQYSLRVYHDNTLALNTIIRPIVPNGDTASKNHTIFHQASRFVIGKTKAFDDFFKISELLDDTSFERKADGIRQVIQLKGDEFGNDPTIKLMKEYLEIYDRNGKLTFEEEQNFYRQFQIHTVSWKKTRLK